MASKNKQPTRAEVPAELTWNLSDLYESDEEMKAALRQTAQQAKQVQQLKGKLADNDGQNLLQALQQAKTINADLEQEYVYAMLRHDSDTTDAAATELMGVAEQTATTIDEQLSFLDPEIVALDGQQLQQWLNNNSELQEFRYALHQTRLQKGHVLSADQEKLLSSLGRSIDSPSDIFNTLNDADLKFGQVHNDQGELVELTDGNRGEFAQSKQRKVRKEAFLTYQKPYHELRNTFAATLNDFIDGENTLAKLRHYSSSRAAALSSNEIDERVYQNLIKTVNDHLDVAHRWYRIKQQALGLDDFYQYDVNVPLAKEAIKADYNQGKKLVLSALSVLGPEYEQALKHELTQRWVDVAENKGKRSGGYEVGIANVHPYVLLNWSDQLESTFTLAHESGHAMHSWFSQHAQPSEYAEAPIFLAEIASTFNENILTKFLLQKYEGQPDKQLYVLEQSINGFIGTIFRQTQFAEFEDQAYVTQQKGQRLTADYLDQLNQKLVQKYYGPTVKLAGTPTQGWAYVPHFYMHYYVYQYATSWAIATTLAEQVWEKQSGARDRYLDFLRAGGSASPLLTLKKVGIDVTKPDYLEDALAVMQREEDQLEQLLKQ